MIDLRVTRPSHARICVAGDLDDLNIPQLESFLADAGDAEEPIVVDLRRCTYVNTHGIYALVQAYRRRDGRLRVCLAPTGAVARVFSVCGFVGSLAFVEHSTESACR